MHRPRHFDLGEAEGEFVSLFQLYCGSEGTDFKSIDYLFERNIHTCLEGPQHVA